MEYPVSRVVVQSLCDELTDLVPYLSRVIDSLERNGGLYAASLADVVPPDAIEELEQWLADRLRETGVKPTAQTAQGLHAELELLERIFPEYVHELVR